MEANTAINIDSYNPREDEREKASNGYLMSMIALTVGLPLPIINLLATLIFYLGNRRASLFVRWHCTQALLSQLTIFVINSVAFTWTLRILFGNLIATDQYFAYVLTIALFNILELIATVIAASRVRNGKHVSWWFWGPLTHLVMKTDNR